MSRHWLPKVYLDAKSYQTKDPGASFFGLLEQRSIKQTDFTPDSINHPDSHIYTRGALGLEIIERWKTGQAMNSIAAWLNRRGIKSPMNKQWSWNSVNNIIKRQR